MKDIVLKPVEVYENHMLIEVYDYTYPIYEKTGGTLAPNRSVKKGKPKLRRRMTIDVDYTAYDVDQIRKDNPTLDETLEYYKGYIYNLVRVRILDDWFSENLLEVLDIIREKIAKYYE